MRNTKSALGMEPVYGDALSRDCWECAQGRATKVPHSRCSSYETQILGKLHTDLVGPITPVSLGGSEYVWTVSDEASGASWVRFMKHKGQTTGKLVELVNWLENITRFKVKFVKSDGGEEYQSNTLQEFFRCKGIQHLITAPYSPESNGQAERLNRCLIEGGRSNLQTLLNING